MLSNNAIYLSLNNGKILEANISDGKQSSIFNVGGNQLSKPFINNKQLFIIKMTDVFKSLKKKNKSKIKPVGFVIGINNIYLTTDNGRLVVIDIKTGKTNSILKIDNDKISRPFILNKNLFIVKDNAIIKLD